MREVSVLIGADIVPTAGNARLFETADLDALIGEKLKTALSSFDFRIFNLETPLCETPSPILKQGPNLRARPAAVKGLKALDPSLLTLANNHILDQGAQGLEATVQTLRQNGLRAVGAGDDLKAAQKPAVLRKNGVTVGVYACAEHEFSLAADHAAGANPFEPDESCGHIRALRAACDYVLVLYHGGKEYYPYPAPYLQARCRKMIESGADVVVCQHSHCIGAVEKYLHGAAVYGQGNFIFDLAENEMDKTGLLAGVTFRDSPREVKLDFIPLVKAGAAVRLAEGEAAAEILRGFEERSAQIKDPDFVQKAYLAFAEQKFSGYLKAFHGGGLFFRAANKLSGGRLLRGLYSQNALLEILNVIECEAHADLVVAHLKEAVRRGGKP